LIPLALFELLVILTFTHDENNLICNFSNPKNTPSFQLDKLDYNDELEREK
jgi:hypothetical protein